MRWPTCAGSPLTETRPAMISPSMSRREPIPASARTLCNFGIRTSLFRKRSRRRAVGWASFRYPRARSASSAEPVSMASVGSSPWLPAPCAPPCWASPRRRRNGVRSLRPRGLPFSGRLSAADGVSGAPASALGIVSSSAVMGFGDSYTKFRSSFFRAVRRRPWRNVGGMPGVRLFHRIERQHAQGLCGVFRIEGRPFVERSQTEIIEKAARRSQQGRSPRRIAIAPRFDTAPIFEGTDDLGRDCDAADVLDVPTRHGLPPRDDGERFEHGTRIARRFFRVQAPQVTLHVGTALEAPAAGDLHQFEPPFLPVELQCSQMAADVVPGNRVFEEAAQISDRERRIGAQQGRFQYAQDFRFRHFNLNSDRLLALFSQTCYSLVFQTRGGAVWQLVGLITRRSQVQILSPQPDSSTGRIPLESGLCSFWRPLSPRPWRRGWAWPTPTPGLRIRTPAAACSAGSPARHGSDGVPGRRAGPRFPRPRQSPAGPG